MHLPYAPARVSYVFSRLWCVVNQPEVLDGAFWTDTLVLIVSQRLVGCRPGKPHLWNGLGADAQLPSAAKAAVEALI